MADGSYFTRVFANGSEVSKKLPTQGDAISWRDRMRTDLKRAPRFVAFDKDRWVASIELPTGTMTYEDPELDAVVEWYRETKASLEAGRWVDPRIAELTLGEYVDQWRETKVGIAGKTWAGYESLLKCHISVLFPKKLRHLSTADIKAWVGAMSDGGVGTTTLRAAYRLLHSILETAVIEDVLSRNPATGVRLPAKPRRPMRALTVEELHTLAKACGPEHELMILFAGQCGLRIGELTALRVRDFNALKREVNVDKTWTTDKSGKRVEGPPKSRVARFVPVPKELVDRLQEHIGSRKADEFLFVEPAGGAITDGNFRRSVFDPAKSACGMDAVRFHDLRHTCASLLIHLGAPITTVSQVLGHASTKMTLDTYGHFYPGDGAKWMDALQSHVGATTSKTSPSAA